METSPHIRALAVSRKEETGAQSLALKPSTVHSPFAPTVLRAMSLTLSAAPD